jgi:hypothetical protein
MIRGCIVAVCIIQTQTLWDQYRLDEMEQEARLYGYTRDSESEKQRPRLRHSK